MDRKKVKQDIKNCSLDELQVWLKHAEKCLRYYMKYPNDYEMEECRFVISHIDLEIQQRKDQNK